MAESPLVFGSSRDRVRHRWCVWSFDQEQGEVIPLGEFRDQIGSDTAAFELAHAAGSLEDPRVCDKILKGKEREAPDLGQELRWLVRKLADNAIRASEAPSETKTAVSIHKTDDDTVYVVRPPAIG